MTERFDETTISWMKVASKSTRELVQPWVKTLASIWLTKTGFDDDSYLDKSERLVWLMHGLTSLVSLSSS